MAGAAGGDRRPGYVKCTKNGGVKLNIPPKYEMSLIF